MCIAQDIDLSQKKILGVQAADTLKTDTAKVVEVAALDIAQNRGLFIVTPDKKMQMRILGSVRYLVVFDQMNLTSKDAFNTYEIPTGDLSVAIPNYYNGLDQTRLGFEVTRRSDNGDIFIRLETDFAGANGFRIRHAYGQYKNFLLGQTWSLFSHVNAASAMVDFAGPTGSVVTRNPQIRYSKSNIFAGHDLSLGMEYIIPNLEIPDSIGANTFQLIPALSARLDKVYLWGSFQLSGILPTVSGRDREGNLVLKPGWGVSSSVVINSWQKGKWYFQGVMGREITRYFNDLGSNGLDILISPEGDVLAPLAYGYYATYEHYWKENLYSNFTYGLVHIEKYAFTEENTFLEGYTLRCNTFWDIAEGARVGAEAIWGKRIDKSNINGGALRGNLLFYYDF
ncbi:MAG: hypothetical protein HC819_10475 [Cyclobacteriaceae bacterium]|nr:hypothetical protein [Cyclobacteriaceae bacterium]